MDWPNQGPKSKELAERAAARAESKEIPYTLALIEIYRENPGLYEAVRSEVLCEKSDFAPIGSMGSELVTTSEAAALSRDPAERLDQIATIRKKERQVPYHVALAEVKRLCPELAHAARLRVLGLKEV